MRRHGWAAGPGRARRLAATAGALLLTSAVVTPALAFQAATPDAATKAAMDKRTAARTLLSSALGRLATNSNDAAALLDAGRASNELEDYRAAVGFLTRAEQASPRDGAVKAALGSAMVHMESPTRALDYFGEAQLLGAPERLFLADRGLARDLLGQQDAAQRDYQLALSIAPNDEVTRRYALSLGISGEPDRAVQLLTPQLRAQDRAAWRLRAMILAMNGRDAEATEIVNATMPPALAQNILPYLTQMDRLNPAQQAAAAHFGRFPSGELGPRRGPVQVAAATPAPTPPPAVTTGKRAERSKPPASAMPKPASKPAPKPVPAVSPAPQPAASAVPVPAAAPPASQPPAAHSPAPSAAGSPAPVPARTEMAIATPPAPVSSAPASSAPAPSTATSVAPIGTNPVQSSTPVGPGFSIADVGRPAPAPAAAPMTPPPSIAPAGSAVTPEAPLASLAAIASSIEIPPEELARPDNAIGADVLARLREDKKRADAAEEAKREKEEAAAKAKAEADAKAKAEAAEKKANPARIWVQIATGANAKALAFDYDRFAKKNAALFKGKSAATTEWGKTRRLLVGPFKDRAAAQDWLGDYKKAGGDGFLFNSDAGQSVDPVK
ncbi:MAG TPA: SPOR domain-containing protein [Sphingopyxis sp.]|uniref:SPOR domain-containing protein n=1 Tax=Sphingopyxis sp. TaxID=1908224 RepID=UPI002E373F1A|nr:SPOR domain-containing protein [Sphingopyxis sp.]HEX2812802.1 SPOR domain-containing protein [Sphingopyxis sp.]